MNKNFGVLGVLVFALGIAVGWFSRGAAGGGSRENPVAGGQPAPKTEAPAPEPKTADESPAPGRGKRAIREASPKKPEPAVTTKVIGPDSEEAKKIQNQMTKAMADRQRAKFQRHIDKLAEALSLTDAQKQELSKWIDERVAKLETLDFSDQKLFTENQDWMKSLSTSSLEDHLTASLSEPQKEALDAFRDKETHSKVDTMALKSLSQLQGMIDLEEGQRDEVYKILSAAAEEKLKTETDSLDPTSLFTDGMGFDIDPYDLGIQDAMQDAFKDMGATGEVQDHKMMATNLRKVIDERIESKVEQLRPVLNDKQLEQYRTELKRKGTGMFGGALMGLDGDEEADTSSTIVIPAN